MVGEMFRMGAGTNASGRNPEGAGDRELINSVRGF